MASRVHRELVGMIDRALGDDPKAALIACRQLKEEVEWLTERSVALARREGFDWATISRLLAISRQWARERFKRAPPRLPPHVVATNRYLREKRESDRLVREFRDHQLNPTRRNDDEDDDVVAW